MPNRQKKWRKAEQFQRYEKFGPADKQFRTEAVGRAPVEKPERPSTSAKRDLSLNMAAVVTKRAQEKHSSVI